MSLSCALTRLLRQVALDSASLDAELALTLDYHAMLVAFVELVFLALP